MNGSSFVDGWEQKFFISKWSMQQLVWISSLHCIMYVYWTSICFPWIDLKGEVLPIVVILSTSFYIFWIWLSTLFSFQLIECPSIYELMACLDFKWEHIPLLEIWRQKCDSNENSTVMLESYPPVGAIPVFMEALSANKVSYYYISF